MSAKDVFLGAAVSKQWPSNAMAVGCSMKKDTVRNVLRMRPAALVCPDRQILWMNEDKPHERDARIGSFLTPTVRAWSPEPLGRAGDDAASPMHGAAALSVAHGSMGSGRSFRRCRALLSCTAHNSCNSRTWRHLCRYCRRSRSRTMD